MNEKGQTTTSFGAVLLLLLLAAVCFAALLSWAMPFFKTSVAPALATTTLTRPVFKANEHAKEHAEAVQIEKCLNTNGPYQTWRDRLIKDTFYVMCEYEPQKWGIAVCTAMGVNKTMFAPKGGVLNDVIQYLYARATRFNAGLPADCK